MFRIAVYTLGLFVCAVLTGCGDGKSNVTGTVTFDGQPVKSGSITFVKSEGGQVREGAVIKDGSFETSVPPGKYKIEITAQKVTSTRTQKGFDGKDEVIELTAEMIPEWYNKKTELTEEIKSGATTLKFDLKSKK